MCSTTSSTTSKDTQAPLNRNSSRLSNRRVQLGYLPSEAGIRPEDKSSTPNRATARRSAMGAPSPTPESSPSPGCAHLQSISQTAPENDLRRPPPLEFLWSAYDQPVQANRTPEFAQQAKGAGTKPQIDVCTYSALCA